MAKVAVVGGGAAGIGAAIALTKAGMDVSLFESEARLGGHCFGVLVTRWDRQTIRVDAGVSVFNSSTFSGFGQLLQELDLRCLPVNQDFSVMTPEGATVWFSRAGQPHFRRQPTDAKQLLDQIDRFNRTCAEVLDDATYADWSAQRYLDEQQYSDEFRTFYFYPRLRGECLTLDRPPAQCSIRSAVSCWQMLGIDGPGAAGRMAVQGGMHAYCDAVERWLRARKASLFLSTRVASISRLGDGVRIRVVDRDKASAAFSFDHVVIATPAHQTIALLEDATQDEARIYAQLGSQRARLVVHQDAQLMPVDRATWGALNYYLAPEPQTAPTMTLYVNRLQNLPASVPDVFVTMNPLKDPEAAKIIVDQPVVLPLPAGADALAKLDAMQGKRRTWFCGGYLREPFAHEQAYRSGLEIGDRLVSTVADESLKFEAGVPASPGGFDDFLREIPLFATLDARALSEVQLVARPFQADPGTMLFRQGEPSDGLYLIKRGQIEIARRTPGDRTVTLTALGPGAVLGELSLLDGKPRSAHAIAAALSFGYFISSERFQMLRSDYRPAAFAVMDCFRREVATRARKVIEQTAARAIALETSPAPLRDGVAKGPDRWPEPLSSSTFDADILGALPFFRMFRPAELREFVAPLNRYDFSPGQLVYAAGEPARSCLVIVRGALSLNFAAEQGTLMFSLLGPGKIAGELALLDGGPHPLACIARESATVFEVDQFAFELLRRGGSSMALKFFEAVTSGVVAALRRANAHEARIAPQRASEAATTPSEPGAPIALEAS